MLSEFPEFSTFDSLLSQTKLADEINQRQTITVLAVDNGAAGAITSLPADAQKKVLAAQVILDYYDPVKLDGIKDKAAQLTTLFQASGGAAGQSGFLRYKEGVDDQMAFGSAEPGAPLGSKLVKVVASRPYNISVMQVTAPIVPPSKGGTPSPAAEKANASSAAPSPSAKPEEAPEEASAPTAEDGEASAPSSEDGNAPAAAEEPSPVAAEGPSDEDSAASSAPESEKSTDAKADAPTSAGSRAVAGASVGLVGLVMWMII